MPTGGGKSLCYQLPSLMRPGLTIVVSPLIALMNDQVKALRELGIAAGCIHSGLDLDEKRKVFSDIKKNKNYLLYLSPERIQKPGFAPWLKEQNVGLFAVDEAHCVSKWGHDFRKEYSQLSSLRLIKPDVPMMGLTATATPQVKRDIIKQLGLKTPDEHVYGFYRPNLFYQVEFCEEESQKEAYVLSALKKNPTGRVIVYCGTRKKTKEWADSIKSFGDSVGYYHAGLSSEKRISIEEKFNSGELRVLCATNAFGMGIDHPDVRLVVHTQMPGNIESYYQEIGRAGRDGKDSTCLLAYSKKDKGLQAYFITSSEASEEIKAQRWTALNAMTQYSEGSECRHSDILTYFKDKKRIEKCGHCDTCKPDSDRKILVSVEVAKSKISSSSSKKRKKKKTSFEKELSKEQILKSELIREWRKAYAKEKDIPAFMIFSDKTLKDLVQKDPKSLSSLEEVYGLGKKKIEVFGEALLGELSAFS